MTLCHASTPWYRKSQRKIKCGLLLYVVLNLLSQSGDIEVNPGPVENVSTDIHDPCEQFSCLLCNEKVSWERVAICCDTCSRWAHRDCAGINTFSFERLKYKDCMWICSHCDSPNYSSILFNPPVTTSFDNRFSVLSTTLRSNASSNITLSSGPSTPSYIHTPGPSRIKHNVSYSYSSGPSVPSSINTPGSSRIKPNHSYSFSSGPSVPSSISTPGSSKIKPHLANSLNKTSNIDYNSSLSPQNTTQESIDLSSPIRGSSPINRSTPKPRPSDNKSSTPIPRPSDIDNISSIGISKTIKTKAGKLKLLILNCQSIKNKGPEFEALVTTAQPDIVIGTESWLDDSVLSSEYLLTKEYEPFRADRKHTKGGGSFILVSRKFESTQLHIPENPCELVFAQVNLVGCSKLIVGSFYRSQATDFEYFETFDNISRQIITSHPSAHVWIGGDFNLPDVLWDTNTVPPGATDSAICHAAVQLALDSGLTQVVDRPTRGKNTLDLLFTNRPSLISRLSILPPLTAKADHSCVLLNIDTKAVIPKKSPRKIYNFNKANWDTIKSAFSEYTVTFMATNFKDVQQKWNSFESKVIELIENHIPSKLYSGSKPTPKPWITKEIKKLIDNRDSAHGEWLKTDKKDKKHETKYHELKSKVQNLTRKEHWKYTEDFLNLEQNTLDNPRQKPEVSKKFWTFIKSKAKDFCSVAPLKKDGVLISDAKGKADILNAQYSSVFTKTDLPLPSLDHNTFPSLAPIHISTKGVHKMLSNLNPNKASGPDNIPPRFLKELSSEIAPVLTSIFQSSLDSGEVPSQWREANVTPIFKKGEKSLASNYRPVSLTSVCCKLCEHVIAKAVMSHLEDNNILSDFQHGFRAKRSCETQLLTFFDEIVKESSVGGQTDVVIMDFSKAFDVVPHNLLLHKLQHLGITGNTLKWIRSFLIDRHQQVVVDGKHSSKAPVTSGVPQGSVLGPILFLCYINDMPACVSSKLRLFADDSIIYKTIKDLSDCLSLQRDLVSLEHWERTWGMSFHPNKCNVIRMTRKRDPIIHPYTLKGHTLEVVTNAKYLGVSLSNDLTWTHHINNMVNKSNRKLGFVRRNIRTGSFKAKSTAYAALVRPHLEYCSSVWDPHQLNHINQIESIQRRAARYVHHNYERTASVTNMIIQLEWNTLQQRRQMQKLTMLYKIVNALIAIDIRNHAEQAKRLTRSNQLHNYVPISTNTSYYKASFFPSVIPSWNALPTQIKTAESLGNFKTQLQGFFKP